MSQKDMFHSDSNTLKRGCQVAEAEVEACPCGSKESFAKCPLDVRLILEAARPGQKATGQFRPTAFIGGRAKPSVGLLYTPSSPALPPCVA